MANKIFSLFWSTRVALVLLVLILLSCIVGAILPAALGREAVFSSLWFNFLLVLLIVNIIFCIFKRIRILRLSLIGTTIFHLSLVLLFTGVVYDQLFFFEGAIRLTEGETLSCAKRASYDWVRKGRFFKVPKLEDLGEIYLHKLRPSHFTEGRDWGAAYEIAVGKGVQRGRKNFIYVNHPLKYKGFEFYRDKEGYSPLFVLRDSLGKVLYGAYAPLQSIEQKDGTYLYRSGSAAAPGSFNFPQDPQFPTLFSLQVTYYPDKVKKRAGEVFFQARPIAHGEDTEGREEKEPFKGRAALGKTVKAGDFSLSMEEVRYWTSMKVIYRPGAAMIFSSFWLGLGGLTLSVVLKMAKGREKEER
ncbi:MAG: cytochrome c biogenesis protein ResB [Thermodesulfovibrionales bacterium]